VVKVSRRRLSLPLLFADVLSHDGFSLRDTRTKARAAHEGGQRSRRTLPYQLRRYGHALLYSYYGEQK